MLFDGKFGESMLALYMLALIGYPVAFVLGIPLIVFLQYRNWNGLVGYVVMGIFLGLLADLPYLPFYEMSPSGEPQFSLKLAAENPGLIGLGIFCGMVATVVFWLMARPDRARAENVSGV